MKPICTTAMILAAGLGLRMRPLTLETPKPLLEVGGRTMLDHAIDKLRDAGVSRVVVNTYHLADKIENHLAKRKDIEIVISRESELLDTGGGIKKARGYFDAPFFALNADLPWMDGTVPGLKRMADTWDATAMDALLLLMPTTRARGFEAKGDFALENGRVWRKDVLPPRPYVWISAQILKPELFDRIPGKAFSNNLVWDDAEARDKLRGLVHEGTCYHVGTPEDIAKANELLASGKGWQVDNGTSGQAA
ncbi:MAG: nucleotidyltransferase family protein [Bdellovibrionales bacterium]